MPYLMINLDDIGDCQRGLRQLRGRLRRAGAEPMGRGRHDGACGPGRENGGGNQPAAGMHEGPARHSDAASDAGKNDADKTGPAALPLRQKLARISQRGVWRFVSGIAQLDPAPRSLAELDVALSLPPNKMRSTKAIFAKLENRFDLRFLRMAEEAGNDDAGNPRYIMPPRIRKAVREITG